MNLWMSAVFADTDISSIGSSLAIDDTVSDFGLLRRRSMAIMMFWLSLHADQEVDDIEVPESLKKKIDEKIAKKDRKK